MSHMSEFSPFNNGGFKAQIDSVSESAGGLGDLKRKRRRKAPSDLNTSRLPPHAPEAEQGVLGCCLLSPTETIDQCIEILGERPEPFYDLRHQTIYTVLVEMFDSREPIDVITLQQRLKDRQLLEQIGGIPYLNTLQDCVPSAANVTYYAQIVSEKFLLRKMIHACTSLVERVYEYQGEVDVLIDEFERDALAIRPQASGHRGAADVRALQQELQSDYEAALRRRAPMGILTGYTDLDRKCGGLMGQELVIVSGVPSSGKTTLCLNIAGRVAASGIKVSFISMETSAKKIVHRLQSMLGQVEGGRFMRGVPSESDFEKMTVGFSGVRRIADNLLIHDSGALTESQLLSTARQDYQAGTRLFVLDYLQLLRSKGDSETERVSNASKTAKGLAAELDVPVIVVSSLRRQELGKPRKPTMSDLRQSGQIEYDADKILLLHCEDIEPPVRSVECNVAKNKDGALGVVEFTFFAGQFRIESTSQSGDEDIPTRAQHND